MTASDLSPINADLASMGLLAGTLGLTSSVYHIGFVVPDIDAAVVSMSDILGGPGVSGERRRASPR